MNVRGCSGSVKGAEGAPCGCTGAAPGATITGTELSAMGAESVKSSATGACRGAGAGAAGAEEDSVRTSGAVPEGEASATSGAAALVCAYKTPGAPRKTADSRPARMKRGNMQSISNENRGEAEVLEPKARGFRFADNALMQCAGLAQQSFSGATLYIVGLPIGNAADITLRALWVLDACDVIACEDTRQTKKLLERYGIATPTMSVHEHNEHAAAGRLIDLLREGRRIALVTDAGTPAVSDPGAKAVALVRQAGFSVSPVPGASAAVAALSASGLSSYRFTFAGFVPPAAKARREALRELAGRGEAFVLYEAPHRICALLTDLAAELEADRRVVVARELTKRFETFSTMPAGELAQWAQSHEPRGEYVIAVDMREGRATELDDRDRAWLAAVAAQLPPSRAASLAARVTGLKREALYRMIEELGAADEKSASQD